MTNLADHRMSKPGEDGYPGSGRWCIRCSCGGVTAPPVHPSREAAIKVYCEHLIELGLMEPPKLVKPDMNPVQAMMAERDELLDAASRLHKKALSACTEHTEDGGDWYVHCTDCRARLGGRCGDCGKTRRVEGCMSPCQHCGVWRNM